MKMKAYQDDKKWMAECDARTLVEAEKIMADKKRSAAAKKAAAKLIKEKEAEVNAMKKIGKGAGKKSGSKTPAKKPSKKY